MKLPCIRFLFFILCPRTLTLQKPFFHLLEVEALFPCRSRARSSLTTVANSLAKTGYAESELRDARSRLSPSADSQATAKRTGPTKSPSFTRARLDSCSICSRIGFC